ncbi:MAG: 23S rRNA (pseudouridine(1915)-N(3))-methyltransferase RlmH [Pseudomonadota bacterium]
MRVTICAVGRARGGPEAGICADYLDRFSKQGRALGLGPAAIKEVEPKGPGTPVSEATALRRALPAAAHVIALDERGRLLTSPDFAAQIGALRDRGLGDLAFLIGGADGLDPTLRDAADARLSFGPMVWPHMLARAMICEQLYRSATILAGSPYHRG